VRAKTVRPVYSSVRKESVWLGIQAALIAKRLCLIGTLHTVPE
jgi:hypothetical protein